MHFITLGSLLLLANLAAGSKPADAGIEFVKACDSGPDDVTNQCINRIPDDIGKSSGNHACAYHEAEVRCLGLCGNTMTWKVAYNNALKRYRLVCASYIDERIAEKEESGEAEDSQEEAPKRKKSKAAEAEPEADKNEDDEGESKKPKEKPQPAKSTAKQDPKSSQKASETAHSKPTSTKQPGKSSSASKTSSATKTSSDNSASETSTQTHHSTKPSQSKSKGGHAMLPTMDPELADSAPGSPGLAISSLLAAIVIATFY
ncbi:hypothetical protein H4R22_000102 [Coemansia sp. RSA 1290]|nr:hypothetical protein H4R22_000102 [Coemansia sp. RSA 1290]KAJ2651481.1 hypothetical protein IWW40_001672 [Coemansia sp. RSA 1250]